MHVATIIPIARGIPFDTLTYYAPIALQAGTLVSAPFGKQIIVGIVIESTPLAEAKALIKQASFSLKKIKQVLGQLSYFTHAIQAIQQTASETTAPIGAIAGSMIPQLLFEYIQSEKLSNILTTKELNTVSFEESVITASLVDRADQYKRIIRSAFASKQSVFFVAPTIRALTQWEALLNKGIQKHIVVLHSKTTKKNLRTIFSQIKTSTRPLLVFVTPGFFLIPRNDLGVVIVEDESSSFYKTVDRYTIDTRIVIRHFCEHAQIKLWWGDTMPRFETLKRLNQDHLPRSYVPEKLHIIPVDHHKTVLPSEVMDLIRHAQKKKFKLFIYTNRKGIAPLSRCADCATVVTCSTCELPIVLRTMRYKDGTTERTFVCTHCGDSLPTTHTCVHCGGWNIQPLAIGTESLREEITSLVGEESVVTVDDDITPDGATIESLIKEVQAKKFVVIVGTVKALPFLKGIQYTIIPYIDRAVSIPTISTAEQIVRLMLECNEKSSEGVIVCTKNPEFPILKQLAAQKINTIIQEELKIRQELGYPPFGLLLKISLTVPASHITTIKEQVTTYFKDLDITTLPPRRISPESMKVLMVWIIKTAPSYLEDEGDSCIHFLDSLRFPYKIEQNPDRF